MPDFEKSTIGLRYKSLAYGPHTFNFEKCIPSGVTVSSCTVKTYLTKVDKDDDLTTKTESTSELVNVACDVSGSYNVRVYLDFPTTAAYFGATGVIHTIVFEVTLSNGATHNYFHHQIRCWN